MLSKVNQEIFLYNEYGAVIPKLPKGSKIIFNSLYIDKILQEDPNGILVYHNEDMFCATLPNGLDVDIGYYFRAKHFVCKIFDYNKEDCLDMCIKEKFTSCIIQAIKFTEELAEEYVSK